MRAWLPLGGLPVARHQLALALALGCQRIVCIAARVDPALIELQHLAEAAGARFHVVPGPGGLLGMVTTSDELIALADGLLVWPASAVPLIEAGPGVLAQPVAGGLAAGFERLDADLAGAGVLRLPGRLIERLAELPPDCDAFAALQRIALQAGIAPRPLPDGLPGSARWLLLRDETAAHAAEAEWIALYSATDEPDWPSRAAARWLARKFGPALLHAGSGAGIVAASSAVVGLLGLVARWFALPALGFGCAALAGLGLAMAAILARIEARSRLAPPGLIDRLLAGDWALDALLLALIGWTIPAMPGTGLIARLFAPLMLLGLLRLVPRAVPLGWTRWLHDRVLLALGLTGAACFGVAAQAVGLGALALLAAGLAGAGRLTRA
ncbi:MAG: hypothetical protein JSS36_09535 [Proteobacteria bacterium]|nr:hypothetical protein [Pseudomonadota bacterium]